MKDPNMQFTTQGVIWVGHDLYIEHLEAVLPLLDELRSIGYEVESLREAEYRRKEGTTVKQMEKGGWSLWYARLADIRRGKCGSCQSLISVQGIQSHGHTCEVCGAITYLEMQDNSSVRFSFIGEEGFLPPQLQMKVYRWDITLADLYLYPDPLDSHSWGVLKGEKAQALLDKHQGKWERVEMDGRAYLKVKYANLPWTKDHEGVSTIDVSDIYNHYWNHRIVKLWEGKEYGEWDDFPVPESISIYEAWHWAPLERSPKLHEQIIHAAGMFSDQGYYYQDGRAAFYAIHWERMRMFVDKFTVIDVKDWDRAAQRFRHDGPGAIADIAKFCSSSQEITNSPNFGNSIVALGKALSGEGLTDQEIQTASARLRDPHMPHFD